MAIKFESNNYIATMDLLEAAQECCDAYELALQSRAECTELITIMDNIIFAKKAIADHGAKWYLENCDPENELGKAINVAKESLSVKTIEAGLEDATSGVWDKIKEFFERVLNWIKGLFSKKSSDITKDNEAAATTALAVVEKADDDQKKKLEAEIPQLKMPQASKKATGVFKKFFEFCGEVGKDVLDKLKGVFSVDTFKKLKDAASGILNELKTRLANADQILTKFGTANTVESVNSVVTEAEEYMTNTKNAIFKIMKESGIPDSVIDLTADDGGVSSACGMKSLTDCTNAVKQMQGQTTLAIGFDNLGGMTLAESNKIKAKLSPGNGDEALESAKARALKTYIQMMTFNAQCVKYAQDLPVVCSEFERQIAEAISKSLNKKPAKEAA